MGNAIFLILFGILVILGIINTIQLGRAGKRLERSMALAGKYVALMEKENDSDDNGIQG